MSDQEIKESEELANTEEAKPAGTGETGDSLHEEINQIDLKNPSLKELIRSSDSPSRYFTWLSLGFAILALSCYGILIHRYLDYRKRSYDPEAAKAEEARLYGGWLNNQHYFNRPKKGEEVMFTQSLGEFRVTWPGAELRADLVAECTEEETCKKLDTQPEKIHDLLLPVLQASSPEAILSPNRKMELRRELADKLNDLKFKGKIILVDFSDLTIEPAPGKSDPTHE